MLPQAFIDKYQKLLGSQAADLFKALTAGETKKAFRVNSLKAVSPQTVDLQTPVPGLMQAFYGQVHDTSSDWVSGTVYSQEPAAMFPAAVSGVQPGERVLDLCAAPGGKSTALAEKLRGQGLLVANEMNAKRAKILRENLERWGATNVVITNASPDQLATHFQEYFDCIVVDAPCSGEGMFRKDPVAMDYWSPDYVQTCQDRQKKILQSALQMLKPGGRLVYSTCTFSPEEDEQIAEWLLEQGLQIKPLQLTAGQPGRPDWTASQNPVLADTVRFWPQDGVGEGQYLAMFTRPGAPASVQIKRRKQKRQPGLSKADQEVVKQALDNFILPATWQLNWRNLQNRHGHVVAPVLSDERLQGLHVLSNGVELGQLKPHRFIPSQQLAQVLGAAKQTQVLALHDEASFKAYLHGETIKTTSSLRGYVLVSYHDQIFSFGKIGNDQILKNFYPKGLRH